MEQAWWKEFYEYDFMRGFLSKERPLDKIVDFLIDKLFLEPGDLIFDQCCGTGDIAFGLIKKGMRVIGVDQGRQYIQEARKIAAESGADAKFAEDDAFTFKADQPCDAAINWYSSFGYSVDDKKNLEMLKRVSESLKPGGYFALDYYNASALMKHSEPKTVYEKNINGKKHLVTRNASIDRKSGLLHTVWEDEVDGKKIALKSVTRMYTADDFMMLLRKAGFGDFSFYGDIDGSALTDESPRCIVVSKKS